MNGPAVGTRPAGETDVTDPADPPLFGGRRGWTIRRRVRAPDSYGVVMMLIVTTLLALGVSEASVVATLGAAVLAAVTLLFAAWTSRAPARVQRLLLVLVPIVVIAAVGSRMASSTVGGVVASLANGLLLLGAVVAIGRRLIEHPRVDGATILGAICVYLLVGLVFACVYSAFGHVGRAFAQSPHPSVVDAVYFSFVTLATIGYGDLTPGGDLVRIVAVLEALMGQLYLVTVIAVLVSNMGTARPGRASPSDRG
jgi:hypothetical protein